MVPKIKLSENRSGHITNATGITNRSQTFMDSYIYARNSRYNATYEKNKEILVSEHNAIGDKSAEQLYDAFLEQYRILNTLVVKIRNFAFTIRQDVLSNIRQILPSTAQVQEFENAIDDYGFEIGKFKYIKYEINSIEYIGMNAFCNLFNNELDQLLAKRHGEQSDSVVANQRATKYLINTANTFDGYNDGLLAMEKISLMTKSGLIRVANFYNRRSQIINSIQKDFKTFQFYLRGYGNFYKLTEKLKPTSLANGNVKVNDKEITFMDYFVIYKHFSSLIKDLVNIVNFYENQFYNKLYAIQSNIEVYNAVLDYVITYARSKKRNSVGPSKEALTEAWWDGYMNSDTIDAHNLINGNSQAQELLWDDTSDNEDDKIDFSDTTDKIDHHDLSDNDLELAEKELPIKEEISVPKSDDEEVGAICTARSSIVL